MEGRTKTGDIDNIAEAASAASFLFLSQQPTLFGLLVNLLQDFIIYECQARHRSAHKAKG
jgi:hypothetical protein